MGCFIVFAVGVLLFIGVVIWGDANLPCDSYGNTPMKDVPARCVGYFADGRR